ncbi:MAG: iron ABC transporter permease [Bacteroidota bacterium]
MRVPKAISSPFTFVVLLVLVAFVSASLGAFAVSGEQFWQVLTGAGDPTVQFLLLEIRFPRIVQAALVGAGLAIAGAAIQGLFRNPLADQTLIGVSSGAMLFAVLAIVFLNTLLAQVAAWLQQTTVGIAAFLGGLLTTFLVYRLSRNGRTTSVMTMLLAGIAISAFAAAVTGVFIYLSDDQQLRDITFWSMGSLGGANWLQVGLLLPLVGLGIVGLLRYAKPLNAIILGESEAAYLGIPVEKIKARIIVLTALIVGLCISVSGIIGFVGLIIPHFLRLLRGPDYRYLLPASALLGAIFLVLTDTLARTIIAPAELPIGILTAVIGAPFFLWLLLRQRQQQMAL